MTFVDGHIDKGRVVTGSSNFSESGLVDNLEFNVELKNRADYEFALAKFNELWDKPWKCLKRMFRQSNCVRLSRSSPRTSSS